MCSRDRVSADSLRISKLSCLRAEIGWLEDLMSVELG